ncbi:unnamed protein product [Ranitomeya imitator]|uniref:Alpha/beta hydrolase domain-containing protein 17C n=1 Tax=Ranitomeya imitator TaxID=111125 RepID=A0ABN9L7J5_9NEOB|nr:unnamed protein product [Ranitomeya imitator]
MSPEPPAAPEPSASPGAAADNPGSGGGRQRRQAVAAADTPSSQPVMVEQLFLQFHPSECNGLLYLIVKHDLLSTRTQVPFLVMDSRLVHIFRYGVSPENIILYGQSIGTVPTVDLASRYECAAVILHSPLMSGLRVAFPDTRKTYCFDAFPSIDKISKVTSPVLIIHGTEDEVIDFSHGLAMYERCPRAVEPLWVEGAGHNDIELYAQYLERLKQFISHELPNS